MSNLDIKSIPEYISHKRVKALKISAVHGRYINFENLAYGPTLMDEAMFSRYIPVSGDYLVVYTDDYMSFSPAKAFEEGYTRI